MNPELQNIAAAIRSQSDSPSVWTTIIPLIVAAIALFGVAATIIVQLRNFEKQLKAAHAVKIAELRSAHQLKIAEMRQAWIHRLRDALANFHSYAVTPDLDQRAIREFYEAGTQIQLYMNPADPDYEALQKLLDCCLSGDSNIDAPYISISQKILKREWDRLNKDLMEATTL